jgi:long-chain fatty acid transport protein
MSLKYIIAAGFCLLTPSAKAAFSNYNSILIGNQAAGMGGAYTAMAEDVSAVAYYNPSALAFLKGHSFSAAVGIYKKFDTTFGNEEDYTKAPLRINQGYFRAIPSSTGNIIRRGDYTMGLSIVVPDFDTFKGDLASSDANTTTLSYSDESLWVGGAIARKISDTESLGLTLYYTARSYSKSLNDRSFPTGSEAILFNSEKTLTENAIVAILGYRKQLSDLWSFGISYRPPNVSVKGTGSYFESRVDTSPYSVSSVDLPEEKTNVHIPAKLSVGVAYQEGDDLAFALDLSAYQALEYDDFDNPNIAAHAVHRNIVNGSIGAEKKFFPWLKVRAGFFTNFSAHPDPDPNLHQAQPDKVDQLGFSANFAFISSDKIEYTFGGYYTGGRGRSLQQINQQNEVVVVTQHVFTMLVGTAFSF